jgi:23S rRNA G2069 N7-methylase RlmK/C1962 C5-methylase RlmI
MESVQMPNLIIQPRARLFHGHVWIYATQIPKRMGDPQHGDVVQIQDVRGKPLGSAITGRKLDSAGDRARVDLRRGRALKLASRAAADERVRVDKVASGSAQRSSSSKAVFPL